MCVFVAPGARALVPLIVGLCLGSVFVHTVRVTASWRLVTAMLVLPHFDTVVFLSALNGPKSCCLPHLHCAIIAC